VDDALADEALPGYRPESHRDFIVPTRQIGSSGPSAVNAAG
jgi:hypothetical protein